MTSQAEDGELVVRNLKTSQEFKHARGTAAQRIPDVSVAEARRQEQHAGRQLLAPDGVEVVKIRGDVIVGVNGEAVTHVNELQRIIASRRPGDRVSLDVVRYGDRERIDVTRQRGLRAGSEHRERGYNGYKKGPCAGHAREFKPRRPPVARKRPVAAADLGG